MRYTCHWMVRALQAVVRLRRKRNAQRAAVEGPAGEAAWDALDLDAHHDHQPEVATQPAEATTQAANPALQYISSAKDTINLALKPDISVKSFKRMKKYPRFRNVIDRFWMAMTSQDHLAGPNYVTFPQYCKVHVRISKTLSPPGQFEMAEARQVAREDFHSDTGGDDSMTKQQLTVRPVALSARLITKTPTLDALAHCPRRCVFSRLRNALSRCGCLTA